MKRRDFMLAGAVAAGCLTAANSTFADEDPQQRLTDPEAGLRSLIAGNERYVRGQPRHPHTSRQRRDTLTKGQRPFATILACSDSRVPLELLFDQGLGDLFVIRVAGNVVTRYGIGSMAYAQHHLSTPLFMIIGHEDCGAVSAALLPKEQRDQEPKGVRELLDLVHVGKVDPNADPKEKLAAAVEANVRHSVEVLRKLDVTDEGLQLRGTGMVVSAVYELSTGRVRILDKCTGDDF